MCPSTSDLITARLSAYADDVTVIIRSAQDVMDMGVALEVYQKASSSRINWQKCASLLMVEWENEGPPALPQNCS